MFPITFNAIGDIIALVQLGLDVVELLNDSRGARAECNELYSELESLQAILSLCSDAIPSLPDMQHRDLLIATLARTYKQLASALNLIADFETCPEPRRKSVRSRVRTAWASIRWELRGSADAHACLVKVSRSVEMLKLALLTANGANTNVQLDTIRRAIAVIPENVARGLSNSITTSRDSILGDISNIAAGVTTVHNVTLETRDAAQLLVTTSTSVQDSTKHLSDVVLGWDTTHAQQLDAISSSIGGAHQQHMTVSRAHGDLIRDVQEKQDLILALLRRDQSSPANILTQLLPARVQLHISSSAVAELLRLFRHPAELVQAGCLTTLLTLAVSAPSHAEQTTYALCACMLFIAAGMTQRYKTPTTAHVVFVVDLFGDPLEITWNDARSAVTLHKALQRNFPEGRLGFSITSQRLYELSILDQTGRLSEALPPTWTQLLRPGQKVVMIARISPTEDKCRYDDQCPACSKVSSSSWDRTSDWQRCAHCPAIFGRLHQDCRNYWQEAEMLDSDDSELFTAVQTGDGPVSYPTLIHRSIEAESQAIAAAAVLPIDEELQLCKRIRVQALGINLARPPSSYCSYAPFEAFIILNDLDGFYHETPLMPAVLVSHDVFHEDWIRCMRDLAFAWSGRFPAPELARNGRSPHPGLIVVDFVDVWNTRFFRPRHVELIVYRGGQVLTGPVWQLRDDEFEDDSEPKLQNSLCLSYLRSERTD